MAGLSFKPIAILGAGSWGTALALHLARRGQVVRLWSVFQQEIDELLNDKSNKRYLPGFDFPENIHPCADLGEAIKGVEDILIVVPSAGFRQTLSLLQPIIPGEARIICATKGLDEISGQLLGTAVHDVFASRHSFAVLSGPSFAREVAAGLPCAVDIASKDFAWLTQLKQRFQSSFFGVETTDDVIGVQWGGVAKNVIAIATGIADGLDWGANARSAIITRGLKEISRSGKALGGKAETFLGFSGLGDLILTCSDDQSRNRRLGLALGKGNDLQTAEREIGQVVEGKRNAELVYKLAQQYQINMPICETIWKILEDKLNAKQAMTNLFESFQK